MVTRLKLTDVFTIVSYQTTEIDAQSQRVDSFRAVTHAKQSADSVLDVYVL